MKVTYRVLAWVICILVMVQAATHAWFSAGAGRFLAEGGTLDLSGASGMQFPEVLGVIIHGMSGMYVIPVVAIAFMVVGYLTHSRYGLVIAVVTAVLIAIQVALGLGAANTAFLALFHGMNALLIFAAALYADHYMRSLSHVHIEDRQPMAVT